jgi:hypothetical protein
MTTMRELEATGTGREKAVHLDGSRNHPGQRGRDIADTNGDTAESTNNISDSSRKCPSTAATKKRTTAIFSDYSQVRHSTGTPQPNSADRAMAFSILIALIGVGVSAAFFGLGLRGAENDKTLQFESQASKIIKAVEGKWNDFEVAGLWIHEACRSSANQKDTHLARGICSREDFLELYEYLVSTGLDFQAIAWVPNVTHVDRIILEDESRTCKFQMHRIGRGGIEVIATRSHIAFSSTSHFVSQTMRTIFRK